MVNQFPTGKESYNRDYAERRNWTKNQEIKRKQLEALHREFRAETPWGRVGLWIEDAFTYFSKLFSK